MPNPLITMTTTQAQMNDQLRIYSKLQQFFGIGGVTGEPMSSISNRVMGRLLTRRMPWKFNQEEFAPFPWGSGNFMVSQPGFQQIQFAGASVFVLTPNSTTGLQPNTPVGGAGIDLAATKIGNFTYGAVHGGTNAVSIDPTTGIISVQTLDPHPYQTLNIDSAPAFLTGLTNPAFNSVFSYNNTLSTSQWVNGYDFVAIEGLYNFTLQGTLGEHYGSLTAISASGSITTVTVPNTMSTGDVMTFNDVVTNSTLNGQVVTLLSATPTAVTFTTPTGVTITNGADSGYIFAAPSGAPGIFNFSWLQAADVYDLNCQTFPPPVDQIQGVHRKAKESGLTGDNLEIAMEKDHNNGVLTFRLTQPMGNYPFAFGMTYQKRAPKFSKPGDVFPWPDELQFVLFEMCLYEACRMSLGFAAEETQMQGQAAQIALVNALESQDREEDTMGLVPDFSLMGGGFWR